MGNRHVAYRASLISLAGGTIQFVYGLLAILFPYPEILASRFELLFALANVGMIGGIVGLLALDVARPRALGVGGGALAILGHVIRIALSVSLMLRPVSPGEDAKVDAAIPASITLMFLGIGLLGIATLRGKRLTGWQAWAPLLVLAAGIITGATFSIDKFVHFILLGLFSALPWLLVGSIVFRQASTRDEVAPASASGSTATP